MTLDSSQRGYAAALAAVVVWALVPVGTRYFVLRVDPYMFNAIRFTASGGAAVPLFLYAKPWRWPRRDLLLLLGCSLFAIPGYNIPVSLGARTVPAGELGVLIATEPVMIAGLTLMLHRRPLRWQVIGGSGIALLGVMLTSGAFGSAEKFTALSTLEVLFGAFSWSCYTVLAVRLNKRYGTFGVTGPVLLVGSCVLLAFSLPWLHVTQIPDLSTVMLLGAMGLASSLIGFLLWNYAGAMVPAERLGLYLYLLPVVSVYAGIQFLNESLTLQILLGGILIVGGVWAASRASRALPVPVTE